MAVFAVAVALIGCTGSDDDGSDDNPFPAASGDGSGTGSATPAGSALRTDELSPEQFCLAENEVPEQFILGNMYLLVLQDM